VLTSFFGGQTVSVKRSIESVGASELSEAVEHSAPFTVRPGACRIFFSGLLPIMLVALSGCVVRAPQIESLAARVNAWFAPEPAPIANFRWTARVGTEGRLLTLYEVEDQFVFASDGGADLVLFDGWVIRRLQGFGRDDRLDITDEASRRIYRSGADRIEARCQPFENAERTSQEGMLRLQYCSIDGNSKPNVIITLDAEGDIVAVEQAVGLTDERVELRRLRP